MQTRALCVYLSLIGVTVAPPPPISPPLSHNTQPSSTGSNHANLSSLIDLGYAKYQGTALQAGVNQYLGLRYAAAPLGDLRFRAPIDPIQQVTTQDATQQGPICYAVGNGLAYGQSEDCLFVDIFAPSNATEQSLLPVFFWIQGGGYVGNGNSNYNGTDLVNFSGNNIVVVTFNYRVGPFGFLASQMVQNDGDLNAGLLDQRKALEWVQLHITKFGGDPKHVVIVGTSAGAGSVALHLTAYGGRNDYLFVGAIGESVFFPAQRTVSELEFQFSAYASASGCSSGDQLACLRSQDSATLQTANLAFPYPGRSDPPLFSYTPCIDGSFIVDYPYNEFATGKFIKVPIMFGNDNNEGSGFAVNANSGSDIANFFLDNYPKLNFNQTAAINAQYPLSANPPDPQHNQYFQAASNAYGESTFTCPALFITASYAVSYQPTTTWSYRYDLLDPSNVADGVGTPHTYDVIAVWSIGGGSYSNTNAPDVPLVMAYWISFVRALDPNTYRRPGAENWDFVGDVTAVASGDQKRLLFQNGGNTSMEDVPIDQQQRCAFWKSLAVTMEQ